MEQLHWLEYVKAFLSPSVTVLLFVIAYFTAFVTWKKQKKKEIQYNMEVARFGKRMDSCKAVWRLLAYMSDNENTKTVFVTRGDKNSSAIFLRKSQAQEYLKVLPEVFYDQGHGILMPKGVRDEAYHFRRLLYKFLDAERNNQEELIPVKNEKLMETVTQIRDKLNTMLREEAMRNPEV
jgi:hypothetical protein